MAGAEARLDLIAFIGTTEVVPCYKTMLLRVFHQAVGASRPLIGSVVG
jgi:hypothetical protein